VDDIGGFMVFKFNDFGYKINLKLQKGVSMSDKIIQITEENLRKAVESGDLKQLAPEVFKKEKRMIHVRLNKDAWKRTTYGVVPLTIDIFKDSQGILCSDFGNLIGKGPMILTLEWEE